MSAADTARPFSIDAATGAIRIADAVLLEPHQAMAAIEPAIADRIAGSRNMGNSYAWLNLQGLTFGGQPAGLALCFHNERLDQASWNVDIPGAALEGGWPTREAIDAEILFVRGVLTAEMGLRPGKTLWGEIWSDFDAKGFMASNGLRYRPEN